MKRLFAQCFLGIAIFLWVFQFVMFIGNVPSRSMAPTIRQGAVIVGCRITGELSRGKIVVFRFSDGRYLVKRIAGVSGDTIYLNRDSGMVYVNDKPEDVKGYEIMIVPEDCFFMLGDNPEESLDSRFWENPFISREDIVCSVWFSIGGESLI